MSSRTNRDNARAWPRPINERGNLAEYGRWSRRVRRSRSWITLTATISNRLLGRSLRNRAQPSPARRGPDYDGSFSRQGSASVSVLRRRVPLPADRAGPEIRCVWLIAGLQAYHSAGESGSLRSARSLGRLPAPLWEVALHRDRLPGRGLPGCDSHRSDGILIGASSHPTVLGDEGACVLHLAKGAGGLPGGERTQITVCRHPRVSALRTTVVAPACLTPADPAHGAHVPAAAWCARSASGSVSESALA